MLTDIEKGGIC